MPRVQIDTEIRAPIERVWTTVLDIEKYPDAMDTVQSVEVLDEDPGKSRRVAWSVLLQGSILRWEELEAVDASSHTVTFSQVRGDLEHFDGFWSLTELDTTLTKVVFEVSFEIGIPMLAEMLNPVAERSLTQNCTDMLQGIERAAAAVG
jgi:ribosome-associated toxin RatA of RatAB toxin-antitoxin module